MNKNKVVRTLILWGLLIVIAGCSALAPPPPPQPIRKQLADNSARRQRQPALNTSRNALEGSLWRSEASSVTSSAITELVIVGICSPFRKWI